ncbi:hypothetical protein Aau02nite_10450 [Amorphoplanes auranticolor]|uniref:Uncharacterized protein n=1 Tax=Actinoplanes auranticolor TaxID=47988 RepID=A0A919S3T3_9ACTN|nr:hypothetical protein Aau02nite_10450 [Actinoplanes auranticolor]
MNHTWRVSDDVPERAKNSSRIRATANTQVRRTAAKSIPVMAEQSRKGVPEIPVREVRRDGPFGRHRFRNSGELSGCRRYCGLATESALLTVGPVYRLL